METCDCLIVGGGPAGSSCARALVQAGFDVIVLDKAVFPRDKVCAGWITPAVIYELDLDLADYRSQRTLQPIKAFRTGLIGGQPVCTSYGQIVSFGIRRCEFDHYLLEQSKARLRLGEALERLRREQGEWIINDEIRAPLVVGAGGHFCPVARMLCEERDGDGGVVLAQEIEFEMSPQEQAACRVEPEVPELYFCDDLLGYAWCFRKGNFLNIGLGREGETRLSAHVAAFCQWLQEQGRIPPGTLSRFHGHAYRLYRGHPRRATGDGVLLIGDSAGLAYPQSGEGIRPAIESGLMAARVIAEAGGDYRCAALSRFERQLGARFGRLRSKPARSGLIPAAWRQAVGRRLLRSRWFTRNVLINRWFLHAHQAALVPISRESVLTKKPAFR